jgi:hypothetical protein
MAYSTQSAVSDGTLQVLGVSIEFFEQDDIVVKIGETIAATPTDYSWINENTIRFKVPVPTGVEVLLRRVTDKDEPRHIFSEGSPFNFDTLDEDFRQILYIAQEAYEGTDMQNLLTPLDMNGNRIHNVGDPVQPGDATNKLYLDQRIADILQIGTGSPNIAPNVLYVPNGPVQIPVDLQTRLRQAVFLDDYKSTPVDGTTSNQTDLVNAVAAAFAKGADLFWPDSNPRVSTATIPNLHNVRHRGRGVIKVGTALFYVDPLATESNRLYVAPGGSGDGLSSSRPLSGINGAVSALAARAPLASGWTIEGAAGTYNEAVILPDFLAIGRAYLAFTFPAPVGDRADPSAYPAKLDGTGLTGLQGFLSGAGNRISISNLCIQNYYNPAVTNTQQVWRGLSASTGAFVFVVNCGFQGNGLSNVACLPGGTIILTGGRLKGARYGMDNTAGRLSLSATSTTYTVVEDALEYGLYAKHESSTVMDKTEFRNNGKHPAAVSYGAAIFAYKSNTSVDTRGCKFYANNIAQNARGGFVADNPGDPDIYGTGTDANVRRFLCKGGGADDTTVYQANQIWDITTRYGGGSTTSATDVVLLDQIAELRTGYFTNNDQCIRMRIQARSVGTNSALITPRFNLGGGVFVTLGTYRVAVGKYGVIRLSIRPTTARTGYAVEFDCIDAVQNLGSAVGQVITSTADLLNSPLSVEIVGRAEAGTTASFTSCTVELSG